MIEHLPYCGVLVKPDTHQQGVTIPLIEEFISQGFRMAYRFDFSLNEGDIDFLYPREVALPVARRKLVGYLTSGVSSLVLLEPRPGQQIVDGIAFLQSIKGNKEQRTGIRNKFNQISVTDEDIRSRTGKYYDYMMINNFHIFDSPEQLAGFVKQREIKLR